MACRVVLRSCLLATLPVGLWWGTIAPLQAVRSGVATFDDALSLALAAVGWVSVAWLGAVALAVALSASGGRIGGLARRSARCIAPAAVHRAVIAAIGLSISALPAAPVATATSAALSSAAVRSVPDTAGSADSLPTIGRPVSAEPQPRERHLQSTIRTKIVVKQGDSLWTIAERALGHDATPKSVAETWPRWFAANRDEIGPNPDQIRPGMRLVAPSMPTTD